MSLICDNIILKFIFLYFMLKYNNEAKRIWIAPDHAFFQHIV